MKFTAFFGVGFRPGIFLLPAAMIFCAASGAETPLYQQDPYDVVTLKQPGENQVIKVLPLDLPVRKFPENPRPGAEFQLRKYDEPDKSYRVYWADVKQVDFFEQQVLKEAGELIAAGKFEEAYDYFIFLGERYPKMPGLAKDWEDYLYEEAKAAYNRQEYDAALALLREAYARNPQRPELDKAMGMATEKLVEQYMERKRYATARNLIGALRSAYPGHPVAAAWSDRLKREAEETFHAAEASVRADDWAAAAQQCLKVSTVWPAYPGARELAETVHRRYPRVVVGVLTPWSPEASNRLADESLRRVTRLCYRTLTEYLGPGSEGGQYRCPLGDIRLEALGRKLLVRMQPDIRLSQGSGVLTGYDLARQLREMTEPRSPAYSPAWSDLMLSVSVRGVYQVEVDLHRPTVRPEALLQTPVNPQGAGSRKLFDTPANGPFGVPASSRPAGSETPPVKPAAEVSFLANPHYFAAKAGQPRQLIERFYASGAKAVGGLKSGDVQVVDRIPPWDLPRLQGSENLAVGRYAVPRVHCLIPNLRRPLMAQRTFRRALVYGINREAVLNQLLGGKPIEGCSVISGPFPAGMGPDDPLSYAYDDQIAPRPYDPQLALALALSEAAVVQQEVRVKKPEKPEKPAKPDKPAAESKKTAGVFKGNLPRVENLVLGYPDDELAQAACASIKIQLAPLGLNLTLRPIAGPIPRQIPEDVDLLYCALAVGEPVADAETLFGDSGLTGGGSPYLRLALHQLGQATNWEQVQGCLHRIHRLVHEEAAVIPLWQIYDFYAYRKDLRGIGDRPVTLYQNIELWQVPFQYPAEKE
jgi:tetratricopeptide (TPR) repeat protein